MAAIDPQPWAQHTGDIEEGGHLVDAGVEPHKIPQRDGHDVVRGRHQTIP